LTDLFAPKREVTCADAVQWLATLPTGSVDLCVTDIAYESLEQHRAVGTTTRLTDDWFKIFENRRIPSLFAELYRVLAKNAHLYFFCDSPTMFVAQPMAVAAGFTCWKPLVFDKVAIGMGYHYRCTCEFILFLEKGHRNLRDRSIPDVLTHKRVKGYPTEKPEDLVHILVHQSSEPGELVIDPFSGSGTTGAAAVRAGRRFMGCDISERAVELTEARLKAIREEQTRNDSARTEGSETAHENR
jgi:site-specific DNA-methyltransferase (adenine-specific)